MTNPRPITIITGASAGIGLGLARVFARHGHELVLIARRVERLNALADEIASSGARLPVVIAADLLIPGVAHLIGSDWPLGAPSRNLSSTMRGSGWWALPALEIATSSCR